MRIQSRFFSLTLIAILLPAIATSCSGRDSVPTVAPSLAATTAPTSASTPKSPQTAAATGPSAPDEASVVASHNPVQGTALASYTTTHFTGPANCAACHDNLKDSNRTNVAPPGHWRSTMMANAATDPVWQAKVASEIQRTPGLQVVIEEKCSNCHMPAAHIHAAAEGATASMFGSGFLRQDHPLHAAAIDGVTCTLCHQINAEKLGSTDSFSGGYEVDTAARAPDRLLYGPYDNQVGQLMKGASGFDPVYGEQMTRSEFCATCHNLYTPFVDGQGEVMGEFPEQTPYSEWQASEHASAGTQCQDCHMPKAEGVQAIASRIEGLPVRKPFFQHHFVGGNTLIPSVLKEFGGELEVTSTATHFDATIARVHKRIGEQSATLALRSLEHTGDAVTAQFEVKVLTGHKFPTSIPLRRTWLHVTVTDASGSVIFESGKWETDGKIAGNDADASAAGFEPHYDSISAADQVQIYEAILGDTEGQVTYTLLRAARYLKDNRLLPKGFDKAGAAPDIAVYGAATDDATFVGGSDSVTYNVDVNGASGPFTVNAELLYEPLSYRFVQDLLADGIELTNRFGRYYSAVDRTPLLVSATEPAQTR